VDSATRSNSAPQLPEVETKGHFPQTEPTIVSSQPEQIARTIESDSTSPAPDMGMLHGVLNSGVTGKRAIFAGDKVATTTDGFANITVLGSAVLLQPKSLITFNGDSVELERGGVGITTSTGMTVHVDDVTVSPAANGNAKFEVVDNDDTVEVADHEGPVLLSQGNETTVLRPGQHTTTEKKKKKTRGAVPGSTGAVSRKTAFILLGAAGSTAAVLAILKEDGERSTPVSPSKP
jgi:hypothetical protein